MQRPGSVAGCVFRGRDEDVVSASSRENGLYWQRCQESRVNPKQKGVWGAHEHRTRGKVDL